jgi:hypothetical protein
MHKRLAIKVHEGHGDKAHIPWLCVVQKGECLSAQDNALDGLWFKDRVL